jgi:hypothetical protein
MMRAPWNKPPPPQNGGYGYGYPSQSGFGGFGNGNPYGGRPVDGQSRKKKKKDKPPLLVFNVLTPRGRRTTSICVIACGLVFSHAWHTDTVQNMRGTVTDIVDNGVTLPKDITNKFTPTR